VVILSPGLSVIGQVKVGIDVKVTDLALVRVGLGETCERRPCDVMISAKDHRGSSLFGNFLHARPDGFSRFRDVSRVDGAVADVFEDILWGEQKPLTGMNIHHFLFGCGECPELVHEVQRAFPYPPGAEPCPLPRPAGCIKGDAQNRDVVLAKI